MEGVRSEALRGGVDLAKANFCICCEARRRCCPGTVTGGASSGSIECRRHLGDARFVYDDHADAVRGLGTHSSMALAMMVCAMAMETVFSIWALAPGSLPAGRAQQVRSATSSSYGGLPACSVSAVGLVGPGKGRASRNQSRPHFVLIAVTVPAASSLESEWSIFISRSASPLRTAKARWPMRMGW